MVPIVDDCMLFSVPNVFVCFIINFNNITDGIKLRVSRRQEPALFSAHIEGPS